MATEIDSPNTSTIAVVVVVGTLAMLAVSAAVTAYVRFETRELTDERPSTADLRTVRELRTKQQTALEVGPAAGAQAPFSMPLSKAQQSLLAEIAQDPSAATPVKPGEVPGAAPEPAAAESAGPKIFFHGTPVTPQPRQQPGQPTLAPVKPVPLKPAPGEVPKGAEAPATPPPAPAPKATAAPSPAVEQLPAEYGSAPAPEAPGGPPRTPAPSPPPQSPSSPVVPTSPTAPAAPATPPAPTAPTPAAY